MIRVVVDPGVLISAFISQRESAPDLIVRAWHKGEFELIISPNLIRELNDVLSRPKFKKQAANRRAESYILTLVNDAIRVDDPTGPISLTPDPDDDYLVALAQTSGADYLVSGDRHLTELDNPKPPVLTPRQFVDKL